MRNKIENHNMSEENYFRKKDTELREKKKEQKKAEALGLKNERLAKNLVKAGFDPDSMRAILIVPLVETAWADGEVQPSERKAVLETAVKHGILKDSQAFSLISLWLEKSPSDERYITAKNFATPLIREYLEMGGIHLNWILESSKQVASAEGCMLSRIGIGGKISQSEREVLNHFSAVFQSRGPI